VGTHSTISNLNPDPLIAPRDHEQNTLIFRGYTLEQLWQADFEDMFHLLVWGIYPSELQRTELSRLLAQYMLAIPVTVHNAITRLPSVL